MESPPNPKVLDSQDADMTLIQELLEMTPEERLCYHNALIQSIYELRQAAGVQNDDGST